MTTRKNNARVSISARTASRAKLIGTVAKLAMEEGNARNVLVTNLKLALDGAGTASTREADVKHFATVRHEYQVGHMAYLLFIKTGSNLDHAVMIDKARKARDASDATGVGTLKKGQRRRTAAEQAAYNAAKVHWGRLLVDANLKSKGKGAGNKNAKGTIKAGQGTTPPADKVVTLPLAKAEKLIPPTRGDAGSFETFLQAHMQELLITAEKFNQSAAKRKASGVSVKAMSFLQDAVTSVKTWTI